MQYVICGTISTTNSQELHRIKTASKFLKFEGDTLYISGKKGWREVPPIADRYLILKKFHDLAHVHGDRMYQSLMTQYYWQGMRSDCNLVCQWCRPC